MSITLPTDGRVPYLLIHDSPLSWPTMTHIRAQWEDAERQGKPVILEGPWRIERLYPELSVREVVGFLRDFHESCDGEGLRHSRTCWTEEPVDCELVRYVRELEAR